ncbi:MAG: hypothetical protein ACLT9P_01040 [Evtepia gabavorous]
MHADWIQSIERQLAEVPPGCLLESPVSQVPRLHRPGPHWAGRGRVETFSLFPGLTLSHLCFQSETFSHRHAALDSGLEITHCRRGRVGWEMKEGLTLYLGPGDLSLHPMDCCAHSTLRFPLGYYEGFSISLNPDTLSQALPPALALGGVSPQEILRRFCPQGHPMFSPAQTALDHIFSPLLRSAGGPPPALLHVESAGAAPLSLPAGPRRGTGLQPVSLPTGGNHPRHSRPADGPSQPTDHHRSPG